MANTKQSIGFYISTIIIFVFFIWLVVEKGKTLIPLSAKTLTESAVKLLVKAKPLDINSSE